MKRDIRIDVLRSLAILLIVLAHVLPPNPIGQIRIFDVPLMALLLGMSFALSKKKSSHATGYIQYLIKRFKRLILPTWIFLTIFFVVVFIFCQATSLEFPYSIMTLLSTYLLLTGIGYVWIIRVFFVIAIFSPFLFFISKKVNILTHKLVLLTFLLIFQQFLYLLDKQLSGHIKLLFEQLIAISFGYMIVALVGIWLSSQSSKDTLHIAFFNWIIFFVIALLNQFSLLSSQKYPPSVYFLTYGIGVSLLLFYIVSLPTVNNFFIVRSRKITWLSTHSLELYYWHIIPITVTQKYLTNFSWELRYIIVLSIALLITYVQVTFFPSLLAPKKSRVPKEHQ
ncbi:acyltransferase family protein [Liquorilactobacillus capillatus]|uniref:Acyltransferase 3 domain-containing protein n=1 Tax=Liquorilactobacillus capillatus DSM 19910 TaxID=1423731 RepID=A0A0R1M0N5_9LACO|nr:acyltransferase [Liquorilactobacillus capillatus]KRL01484.1 hypothetical protein FC81_GL001167 [Liquorilactobacillus capillatus DSM 19910]